MFYLPKGRKYYLRALIIPFLAIYAKGGESMSPKQKDRTTTNFKEVFSNWYTLFKINIKTLLNTKRRISLRGSFV
jgi:hypothetical protein